MIDAEFIDDRGEAGPEDNVEWLLWAADTYASAVAKGDCYAPEPDWDADAISPGLRKAADEIERLRARVEVLEKVREAAESWCADMALPVDHLRTARACLHLITALDEVKA